MQATLGANEGERFAILCQLFPTLKLTRDHRLVWSDEIPQAK